MKFVKSLYRETLAWTGWFFIELSLLPFLPDALSWKIYCLGCLFYEKEDKLLGEQ